MKALKQALDAALKAKGIDGDGQPLPVEFSAEERAAVKENLEAKPPEGDRADSPISDLVESETNPRRDFGDLKALADSIRTLGILQPILVRPAGKHLEIVFGHRRFRAAKLAGLKSVPVDVREISDVMADEMRCVENGQRKDINPIEEAEVFARLREVHRYSVEQIATRVGKSKGSIYASLKLLALCPEAQKEVRDGKIDASLAVPLARIGDHKVQADALGRVRGMSIRDALTYIHNEHARSLKGAPFDQRDAALLPEAGACVKCPKKTGTMPGLFDDLTSRGFDTCTDVPCFKAKVKATWAAKSAKAKAAGVKVISVEEGNRIFRGGVALGFGSPFIDAEDPMPGDPRKKSVGFHVEKLKGVALSVALAPDAKLNKRTIYKRDEVIAALSGVHEWAKEEAEYHPPNPATVDAQRLEAEARREVLVRVIRQASAKVQTLERVHLRLIALQFVDAESVARYDIEPKDAHTFLAEGATAEQLSSLLYEAALYEWAGASWNGYSNEFDALAKREGVDVKTLEREIIEEQRAKLTSEGTNEKG